MSERFGAIGSGLSIGAGQSVRRNAGDTAFEAFTPEVEDNALKNGNFINNSSEGYGNTPDDWTDDGNANPVQGGVPALTKQNLIDWLGITDGQIEGLWNLNEASGNAIDLSSNGYDLTDNNTVGSSKDGLMARARDFELSNSEYLSIASAANLNITSDQTFIMFVKPESLASNAALMDTGQSGTEKRLFLFSSGKILWQLAGLTTNSSLTSDVALEAGKWYMIVGRYNSTDQTLDIIINCVSKSVTASGTASSVANGLRIGKSDGTTNYFDGLIQNACVLSTALSDDQVKRLFWETLGKKTKLRRATTDGYIEQELPQSLIEQYKGKTLSITGKVWQDTASIAQVSLVDSDGETESTASATTGEYIEIGTTRTIASDTTTIKARAKVSDSDGNAWFKEIQVYEGDTLVYTWNPSKDDWNRFPRLLNGDIPETQDGYSFDGDLFTRVKELKTTTTRDYTTGSTDITELSYTFTPDVDEVLDISALIVFKKSSSSNFEAELLLNGSRIIAGYQFSDGSHLSSLSLVRLGVRVTAGVEVTVKCRIADLGGGTVTIFNDRPMYIKRSEYRGFYEID